MSEKFITEGGLSIPSGKELELAGTSLGEIKDAQSAQSSSALLTENAIVDYVAQQLTLEDLDFTVDGAGDFAIDLDSEELDFVSGDGMDISGSGNAVTFTVETASATNPGMVELATNDETNTGTDDSRAVTPASLTAWTGDTALVTLGTIATGTWQGTAIAGTYIANDAIDSAHYAADSIDSEHYAAGSVDNDALKADAVDGSKIADNAIDNEHLADSAVDTDELAADAVTAAKLADDAVVTANIVDSNVTTAKIADDAVTPAKLSIFDDSLVAGNTKIMIGDGTDYSEFALSGDVTMDNTGIVTVSASAIENSMLNGSIANEKLVNDSVSFGGVSVDLGSSDATPAFDLSGADSYPGDSDLVTVGTIATGVWEGTTIKTAYIEDGNITNAKLADSAVDTEELAADAVTAAKLADDAVVTANIVDANVTNAKMAANSVDSAQYVDGSIDNAHLADSAVDTDELAADAVTAAKLADDAVVTANIVDANVTTAKVANDAITPAKLSIFDDSLVAGDTKIMIGDGTDYSEFALSGDVTMDNTGIVTVSASAIENSMLEGSIANAKLVNDSLTVNSGTGMSGGGEVDLGDSLTLTVDATQAQITGIGTSGAMTTFAGTVNCDEAVTLDTTLGVTGVATFTAESVHNGGLEVGGDIEMNSNDITECGGISGSADEMIISADGVETSRSGSTLNSMSLNAGGGIFTDDAVDMDSTLNVQDACTLDTDGSGSSFGGNLTVSSGTITGATLTDSTASLSSGAWSGITSIGSSGAADLDSGANGSSFGGDLDVGGSLTGVASSWSGALTVGEDDTGYDVKFFGASSGSYLLWDESQDRLEFDTRSAMKPFNKTLSDTNSNSVFTFDSTAYHGAKVAFTAYSTSDSSYTAKEMLVVCDESGNASFVEYGTVSSNGEVGLTWAVAESGGTCTVSVTGENSDEVLVGHITYIK